MTNQDIDAVIEHMCELGTRRDSGLCSTKELVRRAGNKGITEADTKASLDRLSDQKVLRPCSQALARKGNYRDATYWEHEAVAKELFG